MEFTIKAEYIVELGSWSLSVIEFPECKIHAGNFESALILLAQKVKAREDVQAELAKPSEHIDDSEDFRYDERG